MIVKRVSKSEEDGSYTAEIQLTEEQTAFLLNFAIGFLVQQGTLQVFDVKEDGEPVEDSAKDFLSKIDPRKLQ